MAILNVSNVNKSYGTSIILKDVSFSVNKNDFVAIVGDNGEGKSTLLKIITNELEKDSGSVSFDAKETYGYLSQQVIQNINNTLLDEMKLAFSNLLQISDEMERLIIKMESSSSKEIIDRYSELENKYRNLGGYDYIYKIKSMLAKFGFNESYYNRALSSFSGGERTRAELVKLLLKNPSILLLDEPTNHLDLVMIEWLEKYLKEYSGTVIIVSHDQVFIDNLATKILELENHQATMYTGNYSSYVVEKRQRYERAIKEYNLQEKEIKRYEMLIAKFKPKPTKTGFAKSLETKLARMDKLEKPTNHKKEIKGKIETNLSTYDVKLHVVDNLLYGYDNIALANPLTLEIKNLDKICIMGQNGCGKTTLLKCLMDNENKISGINKDVRANIKYFYFDQTQQILDPETTLFDLIQNEFPLMDNSSVRKLLGRFLFVDDEVFKYVKDLSGGEKIRLIFALISLRKYDILYLDEPTNHLDFSTKKVIADILEDYEGTIIMVSHDRYFVNRVANKIIYMQNKDFIIENGNYNDFIKLHEITSDSFTYGIKKEKKEEVKDIKPKAVNNKKEIEKLEKQLEKELVLLDELNEKINEESNEYDWVKYRDLAHQIKEKEELIEEISKKIESMV